MKQVLKALALVMMVLSAVALAQTEAGTVINNTATATYDDSNGDPRSSTSNEVTTVVQPVWQFTIEPDAGVDPNPASTDTDYDTTTQWASTVDASNNNSANPGDVVTFEYDVTNQTNNDTVDGDDGNTADNINEIVVNVAQDASAVDDFDFTTYTIFEYVDDNGTPGFQSGAGGDTIVQQATDAPLTLTFSDDDGEGNGETKEIAVQATIPGTGLNAGDTALIDLVGLSNSADTNAPPASQDTANATYENNNLGQVTLQSIDISTTITADDTNPSNGDPTTSADDGPVNFTVETCNDAGDVGGFDNATGVATTVTIPDGFTVGDVRDSPGGTILTAGTDYTITVNGDGSTTIVFTDDILAGSANCIDYVIETTIDDFLNDGTTPTEAGVLNPSSEVTAADQLDPDSTPNNNVPAEDDQDTVAITVQSADIEIIKTAVNLNGAGVGVPVATNPTVGDTFDYVLTVQHDPDGSANNATNVSAFDSVPAALTIVGVPTSVVTTGTVDAATQPGAVGVAGQDVTVTGINLEIGDVVTITISVTVNAAGALNNTATIAGPNGSPGDPGEPTQGGPADPDGDSSSNNSSTNNLSSTQIDLQVDDQLTVNPPGAATDEATPATPANVGNTVLYEAIVYNTASAGNDATNVSAAVTVPEGITVTATTVGGVATAPASTATDADGNSVLTFNLGTIASNTTNFAGGTPGTIIGITGTVDAISDINPPAGITDADSNLTYWTQVTAADQSDADSTPNNGTYASDASDPGNGAAFDDAQGDDDTAAEVLNVNLVDVELNESVFEDAAATDPFVVGTDQLDPGETIFYTIEVTNNANGGNITDTATGVNFLETFAGLPAGSTIGTPTVLSSTATNDGTVTSAAGANPEVQGIVLAPGQTVTYIVPVTMPATIPTATSIVTSTEVTAQNEADLDSAPAEDGTIPNQDDEDSNTIATSVVDLEVVEYSIADPATNTPVTNATVNEQLEVIVEITNNDNGGTIVDDATGVTINDVLPTGVTFDPTAFGGANPPSNAVYNPAGGTGGTVTYTIGGDTVVYDVATDTLTYSDPISPGESIEVEIPVTVDADTDGDGNQIVPAIDGEIDVQTQDQTDTDSTPGNMDEDPTTDVTEDDELQLNADPTVDPNSPPVPTNDSIIGVTKRVTGFTPPADDSQPISATNFFVVDLEVFAQNTGDVQLTGVQVSDNLDATFGAGNYSVVAGGTVVGTGAAVGAVFNVGYTGAAGAPTEDLLAPTVTLDPNDSVTFTFSVQVFSEGSYTNSATADGTDPEGNTITDTSDNDTDGDQTPDDPDDGGDNDGDPDDPDENDPTPIIFGALDLDKAQCTAAVTGCNTYVTTQQNADPGDFIGYQITATNDVAGTITNVVISDGIPTNTSYVAGSAASSDGTAVITCSTTGAGGPYTGAACAAAGVTDIRWSVPDMAASEVQTFTFEVTVD